MKKAPMHVLKLFFFMAFIDLDLLAGSSPSDPV